MKLLLYCTKAKPYLYYAQESRTLMEIDNSFEGYKTTNKNVDDTLNGKIVAECDYEVEDVFYDLYGDLDWQHDYLPTTNTMSIVNLENAACMDREKIEDQMVHDKGYAIHIKNLHIFDKPKELKDYSRRLPNGDFQVLGKSPQNMMKCCELKYIIEDYILISIQPQWMCKILNGEKTIEVRKKVLKEMIN